MKRKDFLKVSALGIGAFGAGALVGKAAMVDSPQRCANLLVAGRCISFDEGLNYDAREIGTCFVTGQAAGVASALAANLRSSVQEVEIDKLQNTLRSQNVYL